MMEKVVFGVQKRKGSFWSSNDEGSFWSTNDGTGSFWSSNDEKGSFCCRDPNYFSS